jgi:phage-related tail fiber protein
MPISQITSESIANGAVTITDLAATGTPSASTFFRGDSSWAEITSIPSGTVIYVAQNTAPTGYIKANGAAVSRTTYASLFTAIGTTFGSGDGSTTFNVPDLRGEFLRGWDDGRGIDSGRVFGSAQGDAFQGHYHDHYLETRSSFGGGSMGAGSNGDRMSVASGFLATNNDRIREAKTDGTNGTPRTASETRPRNIALLACIKF